MSPHTEHSQPASKPTEEQNQLGSLLTDHILERLPSADQLRSAADLSDEELVRLFEHDTIIQLVESSSNVTTIGNIDGDLYIKGELSEIQVASLIRQSIGSALHKLSQQSEYSLLQITSVKADLAIESQKGSRRFALAVAAITPIILALVFLVTTKIIESTPSPLHQMNGDLNIAFVDFTVVDGFPDGVIQTSEIGSSIADKLFNEFVGNESVTLIRDDSQNATVELGDIAIEATRYGPAQEFSDPEEAARSLTQPERANAHIVVYGYFDTSTGQVIPQFYVSPYLVGAEELMGSSAFGSPIVLQNRDPRSPTYRTELNTILGPRALALTKFMLGLASYRVALSYPEDPQGFLEDTIHHFMDALEEMEHNRGLEIVYSWIGAALRELAYATDGQVDFRCPIGGNGEPSAGISIWDCAKRAHEVAQELSPTPYARAYIGLGNILLDQADYSGGPQCSFVNNAIDQYEKARDIALDSPETSSDLYLEMTLFWDMGHAYGQGYLVCRSLLERLGRETYEPALENLTHVVELYQANEDVSFAQDLGARAFFQLGLIHETSGDYSQALAAYNKVVDIASPEETATATYLAEEPWQRIRWAAWTRIGHVHSTQAENDSLNSSWEAAIGAYEEAISYYRSQGYCDRQMVSTFGEALYYAAEAYDQLGRSEQANSHNQEIARLNEQCPDILPAEWLEDAANSIDNKP